MIGRNLRGGPGRGGSLGAARRLCIVGGMVAGLLGATPAYAHDAADAPAPYKPSGSGTALLENARGVTIKMLVDATNLLSGAVEVGEITFPASTETSASHSHVGTEIFYVLSGTLAHTVNGVRHELTPGMIGIVSNGDMVSHGVVSAEPVRALVIWTPGGEAARLGASSGFTVEKLD